MFIANGQDTYRTKVTFIMVKVVVVQYVVYDFLNGIKRLRFFNHLPPITGGPDLQNNQSWAYYNPFRRVCVCLMQLFHGPPHDFMIH